MTELETILLKSLTETREAAKALLRCLSESRVSGEYRLLSDYLPPHCHGFGRRSDEAIAMAQKGGAT